MEEEDFKKLVDVMAYDCGRKDMAAEILAFAREYCDTQTPLYDAEGNEYYDEEEFNGDNCTAAELRDALLQKFGGKE